MFTHKRNYWHIDKKNKRNSIIKLTKEFLVPKKAYGIHFNDLDLLPLKSLEKYMKLTALNFI